jgi:hypothetical protein
MLFQRFSKLSNKPLLTPISPNVTGEELQALWEAGITGVVIEVRTRQSALHFKKLRQTIDKLTFTLPHRQPKPEALLPRISEDQRAPIDTEEEEEE